MYEVALVADCRPLLEHLLPRVDVLSPLSVADGLFARFLFGDETSLALVRLEDVGRFRGSVVNALVEHLQYVNTDAMNGLARTGSCSNSDDPIQRMQ